MSSVPGQPALGPDDDVVAALGRTPQRVIVAGTSGSGKTTLAGRIAIALGVPHIELDGLHWGAHWTPRASFADDVRVLAAQDAWAMEWQYREVRPLLLERAEVLVWLDLPVRIVMRQLVARTVRRRMGRVVLWNGNVEPSLWTVLSDEDHVVRWAWRMRHKLRGLDRYVAEHAPHLTMVRLRSRRDVDRWVARLEAGAVGVRRAGRRSPCPRSTRVSPP